MIDLIFMLDLHYKKANLQKRALLMSNEWHPQHISKIFGHHWLWHWGAANHVSTQPDCVWSQAGAPGPHWVCGGGPPQGQVEELCEERILYSDAYIHYLLCHEYVYQQKKQYKMFNIINYSLGMFVYLVRPVPLGICQVSKMLTMLTMQILQMFARTQMKLFNSVWQQYSVQHNYWDDEHGVLQHKYDQWAKHVWTWTCVKLWRGEYDTWYCYR